MQNLVPAFLTISFPFWGLIEGAFYGKRFILGKTGVTFQLLYEE